MKTRNLHYSRRHLVGLVMDNALWTNGVICSHGRPRSSSTRAGCKFHSLPLLVLIVNASLIDVQRSAHACVLCRVPGSGTLTLCVMYLSCTCSSAATVWEHRCGSTGCMRAAAASPAGPRCRVKKMRTLMLPRVLACV